MKNFDYWNPTKLIFGKNQLSKVASEISIDEKILMVYGGGSIKKNGIYDAIKQALSYHEVHEFAGVEANPEFTTLCKALEIIKSENITFLLAVGGGSVIDGVKFLASAASYEGNDPWEILANRKRTEYGQALPFGTVLTLPATGSEMNSGAVISRTETNEKLPMGGPGLFPKFSICDPTVVASIPQRFIANGIVDAYTHVLEQYCTYPANAPLQDRISEGILQTLIEIGPKVMEDPSDYIAASNFMWCCTMALNGLIQKGVPTDWSVHMIAHELTAHYGIDHARTLAIILPSAYTLRFEQKKEKLAQYAERVFGIYEGSIVEKAQSAINRTEIWFQSLGIQTKLRDYTSDYDQFGEKVAAALKNHGMAKLGEHGDVTPEIAKQIVDMSI